MFTIYKCETKKKYNPTDLFKILLYFTWTFQISAKKNNQNKDTH